MAIQGSGPISMSDLAAEFGGAVPYSLSQYYREGGRVPGNNVNVPVSGAIRLGQFYNAVNEIIVTQGSVASLDVSSLFTGYWDTEVPKRLLISPGAVLGPVTVPTGLAGPLVIENDGEIQGLGGSGNSGAGGNAISGYSTFTIINRGAIRGGGGGGGKGGTGGTGGTGYTTNWVSNGVRYGNGDYWGTSSNGTQVRWDNNFRYSGSPVSSPWYENSQLRYHRRDFVLTDRYRIEREYLNYNYFSGGAGGAGGNGGRGRGYNQSNASGSAGAVGAAGQTNAGRGGTGGTGGTGGGWAANGAVGATGAKGQNGNWSNGGNGSAGASGGAAGRAIRMFSGTVTVDNQGTINGAYP